MLNPDYTYDLFISYSSEDREWVRKFASRLRRRHFNVFLDEWRIRAGQSITATLVDALRQSRHIVPIMTPNWDFSDWCKTEIERAIYSDPSGSKRRIIPIFLRGLKSPYILENLKFLDFRDPERFEGQLDLLTKELRTLSFRDFSDRIIQKQREIILNQPILPWTPELSPSFHFLWPELFIEPHVKPHKHLSPEMPYEKWLSDYFWGDNIALVGPPGIGKSTTLRAMFIRLTDPKNSILSENFPIILTATDVLDLVEPDRESLIKSIVSKAGLEFLKDLNLEKNDNKILLLVDGLDEVSQAKVPSFMAKLTKLSSAIPIIIFWVACRKDFFFKVVAIKPEWNAFFFEILDIQEWDIDRDSLLFAEKYAKKVSQPDIFNRLISLKKEHSDIIPFMKNPFELTLLLYLLGSDKPVTEDQLRNSYTLYRTFYENWLAREQHRGTALLPSEKVSEFHYHLALTLYSRRGAHINILKAIHEIEPKISLEALLSDTSFSGILILRQNIISQEVEVEKFWHETISEYLVAENILLAIKKGGCSLFNILTTEYNFEVNKFVRLAFISMNQVDRELVLRNFVSLYVSCFSSNKKTVNLVKSILRNVKNGISIEAADVDKSEDKTMVREQILYYIGRLPTTSFPEILRFAYFNEPSSLVRRIAALGAILHGAKEIENDYLSKLTPGTVWDKENRSVQLVYFGDVDGYIYTYRDDNSTSWVRTRNAIYERLNLNSQREIRLRWWDIRTLVLFYESRKWTDDVTEYEIGILKDCEVISEEYHAEKKKAILNEKECLIKKLESIMENKK